jgi:hypothetical protein
MGMSRDGYIVALRGDDAADPGTTKAPTEGGMIGPAPGECLAPPIVGSSNNGLGRLQRIDVQAQKLITGIVEHSRSIRQAAAELIVAGVQMVEIMQADYAAWERFREPFGPISVKGDDREYREVATVLWRSCDRPPKGKGSLANDRPQISRDKISRSASAMATAHVWYKAGVIDPVALAEKIVLNHGVRGCATLRTDKLENDRQNSTAPSDSVRMIRLSIACPDAATLIVVLSNGDYLEVEEDLARPLLDIVLGKKELVH